MNLVGLSLQFQYNLTYNLIKFTGLDGTQRLFRRHIKKLKDEQLAKRIARYMEVLPDILNELIPDINTFNER